MFLHGKVSTKYYPEFFFFNKAPQYSSLIGCKFFSCFSNKKHVTSDKMLAVTQTWDNNFITVKNQTFGATESAKGRFSIACKILSFWKN